MTASRPVGRESEETMSNESGYWRLDVDGFPMEDNDWNHVASLVRQGFTSGELIHEDDDEDVSTKGSAS